MFLIKKLNCVLKVLLIIKMSAWGNNKYSVYFFFLISYNNFVKFYKIKHNCQMLSVAKMYVMYVLYSK